LLKGEGGKVIMLNAKYSITKGEQKVLQLIPIVTLPVVAK
jgi:hypothetical protein